MTAQEPVQNDRSGRADRQVVIISRPADGLQYHVSPLEYFFRQPPPGTENQQKRLLEVLIRAASSTQETLPDGSPGTGNHDLRRHAEVAFHVGHSTLQRGLHLHQLQGRLPLRVIRWLPIRPASAP